MTAPTARWFASDGCDTTPFSDLMFTHRAWSPTLAAQIVAAPGAERALMAATIAKVTSKQIARAPVLIGTLRGSIGPRVVRPSGRLIVRSGSALPYARRQHYKNRTHRFYLDPTQSS